jgi:hypothetical protein
MVAEFPLRAQKSPEKWPTFPSGLIFSKWEVCLKSNSCFPCLPHYKSNSSPYSFPVQSDSRGLGQGLVSCSNFFFFRTGVWTQSLLLAKASTLPLECYTSIPFSFSYFSLKVLCFLPGLAWTLILLPMVSHVARITSSGHHAQLIGWDRVLLTFYPG